jgi:homoserine kinase
MMKLRVSVPGTSANLGPGFDVFGLAVGIYNEFIVEDSVKFEIAPVETQADVPLTKDNLFYQSFEYLFHKLDKPVPTVRISMNLRIQQARGLGSSATAVVGGLVAANAFLGNQFSKEELLPFAIKLERGNNPDNVAPALFGGLIVYALSDSKAIPVKIPFPSDIQAVFFIPDLTMDTITGRKLMPAQYPTSDVVFSTSRVALFLAALQTKNYSLLRIAMEDRIHQPTRTKIFPAMPKLIKAANDAGALGAALSGGGSSIIALASSNFEYIGKSMNDAADREGVTGMYKTLDIAYDGAFLNAEVLTHG